MFRNVSSKLAKVGWALLCRQVDATSGTQQRPMHSHPLDPDDSRNFTLVCTPVQWTRWDIMLITASTALLMTCLKLLPISILLRHTHLIESARQWCVKGPKDSLTLLLPLHSPETYDWKMTSPLSSSATSGAPCRHRQLQCVLSYRHLHLAHFWSGRQIPAYPKWHP